MRFGMCSTQRRGEKVKVEVSRVEVRVLVRFGMCSTLRRRESGQFLGNFEGKWVQGRSGECETPLFAESGVWEVADEAGTQMRKKRVRNWLKNAEKGVLRKGYSICTQWRRRKGESGSEQSGGEGTGGI
ncbi:MAG: hypothetical protein IJZ82_06000 [Lachnospiraceae bacterium]|nr:hypothetical protein [Lachnospiraceae bacterium]